MRNLSAQALSKIATKLGTEPVTIVEIDWVEDDAPILYADRKVETIPGKIYEVGDLDNVVNVSGNDNSQELSITLDDTDGTIKAILDNTDIHKRSARVYQWFEGLDLGDRFLLFAGKVSSPITWSERERTVSFTIVSQLEDREIGFTAEEGDFNWIPAELIGAPWPMIFGTALDVPALQFNKAVTGTTLCPIGDVVGEQFHNAVPLGGNDPSWGINLGMRGMQKSMLWCARQAFINAAIRNHLSNPEKAAEYETRAEEALQSINDIEAQIGDAVAQKQAQEACARSQRASTIDATKDTGCNPVRILGGEDFPQNQAIKLLISGSVVSGYFEDDNFYYSSVVNQAKEDKASDKYQKSISQQCEQPAPNQPYDFSMDVPCGEGNTFPDACRCRFYGFFIPTEAHKSRPNINSVAEHIWIDSGSRVSMYSDENITYVVSIVPGTVLAVKAYKTFEGGIERLVDVPNDLWRAETKDYGPIIAEQVVLTRPLSSFEGQGWGDRIYVTFRSDVGPHTIDILEYIIDNYTDLTYDTASFTAIRDSLEPFPMNFPILERKNTIEVLQEIAFQARCALWLSNGKFYIKYLPEDPTSDATITTSDLDADTGVSLEMTSTEDLVTKMIIEWRLSWAPDDPNKIILRHNVGKYGTQQETFFFYCFNQADIVLKAATFWLIRMSNTWKKLRFKTFLQMLNLETFDTVTLDFGSQGYVSNGSVKAVVEEATYNSNDRSIDFICQIPIKSGEMVEYQFFWPAGEPITALFPTAAEQAAGLAGGGGIGSTASGDLPIGFIDPDAWGDGVVLIGGPNILFKGHADYGDKTPTDVDFEAQQVFFPTTYAELSVQENPDPDTTINYVDPIDPPPLMDYSSSTFEIDIRNTVILDSQNPDNPTATLDSIYKKINEDGNLVIDTEEARYGDDEHPEGESYDYRFDDDGGKWGAGTAFLKDS
jgi:hypothetical protein